MDLDPQLRPGGGPTRDRISSIALGGIGGSPATSSPSSADAGGPVGGCHSVPPSTTISLNAASDLPNRPLSAADSSANAHSQQLDATATTGEQQAPDGTDPKRSRACEACRGLKVRCDPGPNDEQAPCKRCRKAGRRCVVTAPSRKRQKKTDSRVSELEKKIDALTASLQARGATGVSPELGHGVGGMGGVAHSAGTSPGGGDGEAVTVSPTAISARHRSSIDEPRGKGRSRGNMGSMGPPETTSVLSTPTGRDQPPAFQPPMVMAGMKRKASDKGSTMGEERKCSPQHASSPWTRPDQGDIVDRGIISMDQAADLFARYTDRMAPHLPAVIFPPSMTASELRRSKPILFLAVMAAAGSEIHTLQMTLQRELMTVFAEKVFLSGDKSLEIVQALLVAVIWYWPPEHFEELKFYQLVHVAAVMAIDIGLGKKAPPRRTGPNQFNWQTHPFRRHGPPDPTTIESRRTWLGCYFLTCNTSIALHRPYLVRWTSFMSESIDILELSPDAAPTDQYFCHLVQQHHLGEDIGGQFSLDDAANVVDINDARTQYALKALERDLDKFRSAVPEDLMRPTLKIGYNMINLYMHEVALHSKTAADQLRPPFNADTFKDGVLGSEPLSAAHISAISACLGAVDGMFTTFLGMDVSDIRTLPAYNFVRVAYGIVILVKMYFSASSPGSELGKVINKSNLRVEHYLDALLDKFHRTAADDRSKPAAKFLVVLAMLKSWFIKQERHDGKGSAGDALSQPGGRPRQESSSQPRPQSANTPLQLLSEVAAGSDANRARAAFSSVSNIHQTPQPLFHDTTAPSSTASPELQQQQQQHQVHPFTNPSAHWTPSSQQQPAALPMDMTLMGSATGLDFTDLGFTPEGQEGGAHIMLSEPWFSDVFQGFQSMQDTNTMFPF